MTVSARNALAEKIAGAGAAAALIASSDVIIAVA